MKHLLFNWLMRNIYGEELTALVLRFVIEYNEKQPQPEDKIT